MSLEPVQPKMQGLSFTECRRTDVHQPPEIVLSQHILRKWGREARTIFTPATNHKGGKAGMEALNAAGVSLLRLLLPSL